ncbi:MAG: hypothetical protein BMS9Abin28_1546 [Anaerolineae bacterium]|nr:MAG: hypothetical protein BMS9Abin28_1546 [Anaerolineae bacterium]
MKPCFKRLPKLQFDRSFDFHGLVGLRVQTDQSFAADYFRAEYGPASGPISTELPVVMLRWTESSLPRRPDANYRLKIHKGLARWYYRIHFKDALILIEGTGNQMAVPMVHHMLVHGCLRYLCSRRNALLLHAAALAHGDRSLVFAGRGGVGKTTVSSIMLDQGGPGWELHADDYVFLTSSGDTLSYPSRAHMYLNLLKEVPGASSQLSARQRAHLTLFGLVRQVSGERIKWPLRVEPGLLWPDRKTASHARLQALLLLERSEAKEVRLEPIGDLEHLVDELMQVNFKEARHTIELFAGFETPMDHLEQWKSREHATLRRALQDAPAYRLLLPRNARPDQDRLVSQLQHLVTVEDDRRVFD